MSTIMVDRSNLNMYFNFHQLIIATTIQIQQKTSYEPLKYNKEKIISLYWRMKDVSKEYAVEQEINVECNI